MRLLIQNLAFRGPSRRGFLMFDGCASVFELTQDMALAFLEMVNSKNEAHRVH